MFNRNPYPARTAARETQEAIAGTNWWPAPESDHARELGRLRPITLDEMAGVALLDRTETKFVFHEGRLDAIMEALTESYRVLEINDGRLNHYRTLYFDTPDFALFRRHQAGGRNRYKVRSRSYVDTGLSFLEIKHKVKKNRTIKNRVRTADFVDQILPTGSDFLDTYLPPNSWQLEPKLWNEYTRITLVGIENPERVTIDLNLQFSGNGETIILPSVVIAEVKKNGPDHESAFVRRMSAGHIRSTGFSKYCIGVSMIYPEIKHNQFQPKLRMVNKLIHQEEYYV